MNKCLEEGCRKTSSWRKGVVNQCLECDRKMVLGSRSEMDYFAA